eukprot:PhM_4_TR2134/c0_g1_i3/m.54162
MSSHMASSSSLFHVVSGCSFRRVRPMTMTALEPVSDPVTGIDTQVLPQRSQSAPNSPQVTVAAFSVETTTTTTPSIYCEEQSFVMRILPTAKGDEDEENEDEDEGNECAPPVESPMTRQYNAAVAS